MITTLCPDRDNLLSIAAGEATAPEIERHLQECPACQKHLQELRSMVASMRQTATFTGAPETTVTEPKEKAAAEARPAVMGKYLIVGELGRGGEGRVFRGLHPALGRDVAIKWSHQSVEDPGSRDRLAREGRLLAGLDHPGILRVLDMDWHEKRPYLVMEFARGCDMEQHAQRTRPTPAQAAALVARVARALAAAHERGIIHQDIKPANILIDEAGQPRLSDFGMARLRDMWSKRADDQPEGGTLTYMAPEQLPGGTDTVGPASDQYALGGVLFFLLTGRPPRRLPDNPALAWQKVRQGDIDWKLLDESGAPRRLQAICRRALAVNPRERFGGAEEMARALEQYSGRPRVWQRGAGWLAACLACLLVGGAAWVHFHSPDPVQDSTAQSARALLTPFNLRLVRANHQYALKDQENLDKLLPFRQGDTLTIAGTATGNDKLGLYAVTLSDVPRPTVRELAVNLDEQKFGAAPLKLVGSPAIELLIVCGSANGKPTPEEIAGALSEVSWLQTGQKLTLPDNFIIAFDSNKVDDRSLLGRVVQVEDDGQTIRQGLERLRRQLRQRCDFVAGLVFTHVALAAPQAQVQDKATQDKAARGPADNPAPKAMDEPSAEDRRLFEDVMARLLCTDLVRQQYPAKYLWPPRYAILPNTPKMYNAFAGPAGFDAQTNKERVQAVITMGYMDKIIQGNADILAAIMGHELAHILKQHVVFSPEAKKELVFLAFSRDQEIEADLEGVKIAVAANYPYRSGIRAAFREQEAFGNISNFEGIKATHPSFIERLRFLDREEPQIWKAMGEFQNGTFFLHAEQYRTAESCFDRVVAEFPNCAEAWSNLGYACLMQYCDGLDVNDLRKYGIGQFAAGCFYERPQGLILTRGTNKDLWLKAVRALTTALVKDNKLLLPRANLGLAYLVHYDGKPLTDKAVGYFMEARAKPDPGINALNQVAFLINAGVAFQAKGDTVQAGALFDEAGRLLPGAARVPVRDYLEDALLFNLGFRAAASSDPAQKQAAFKLLETYLRVASPQATWWPLAYAKYQVVCKSLAIQPLAKTELSARKAEERFRLLTSVEVSPGKLVTLSDDLEGVLGRLGKQKTFGLPIFENAKIKRYNAVSPGVNLLADNRVLAVFLTSPEAPPLYVQGKGTGAGKKAIRVGMPFRDLVAILHDPLAEKRTIDNPSTTYLFLPSLGLGVRINGDRVSELALAQIPRK